MRSVPVVVVMAEGAREADPVSSPCWTPPCPHRLGVSQLSVAENEGCLVVPDAVPAAEGGASCGGGRDGEITMPFDCFTACPFIREENGKEQSVWRSTDGADGPKQEHDADPSDGLSAKASVVSRAIRPCLRQGCRRPCVAHAQQTAIWRRSGGDLAAEALAGEGRRAGAARGLLGDPSNELCRGEVRWGESSSATPCAFPRLSHWEVFAVPLDVVDNSRSKGC